MIDSLLTSLVGLVNTAAPLTVVVALTTAILVFPLPQSAARARTVINLTGALLKVAIVVSLIPPVVAGARPEWSMPFLPGIDLVVRVEPFSLYFSALSALLWLLTTIYAIGYLRGKPHQSRFFGFFSLCVTATAGISFAGNLVTFLVFYELLTLATYPLVAHWGTPKALDAARLYLRYALTAGLTLLVGVVWLTLLAGPIDFAEGGAEAVARIAADSPATAIAIFVLLIGGLSVKAALVPVHGWLPKAMVAPAPVSALLHAVAVVKAGVFGVVRVIDDVYGVPVAQRPGVLTPLLVLASITILYGSYQALRQSDLKARLAYSTVSQVSYITLGICLAHVTATTGGLAHIVHQGVMKITLFFCAGLFAEVVGVTTIRGLAGVGRRMPLTSAAFTVGAFGMIGVPPTAGFVTKWYLGVGAVEAGQGWVVAVLMVSSLLNAAYFLPIVYLLWFVEPRKEFARGETRAEAPLALLVPAVVTMVLTFVAGLAAGADLSPLYLAHLIAQGVFS